MDLELLDETLAAAGEPAFRARQAWRWTASGAAGFEEMTDLPAGLREHLAAEEPPYRASQVWEWVARGARSYAEMTNLPAGLRERLAEAVPLSTLTLAAEAKSDDGTVKALFHTHDGRAVEAVLMRFRDGRRSICVSSQSGCPLTCTFCATGSMRLKWSTWSRISLAVRLRPNFIAPVAQNVHVSGQPDCEETQIDRRPSR